jgi:hypothetical protein
MKGLELQMQCFQGEISTHHLVGGTIGLTALKKSHLLLEMSVRVPCHHEEFHSIGLVWDDRFAD